VVKTKQERKIFIKCAWLTILFNCVSVHGSDVFQNTSGVSQGAYSRMRDTAFRFCKGVGGNDCGLLKLQSNVLLDTSGKSFV
jgi:hypothetical protein